jgi:hypothetical protein
VIFCLLTKSRRFLIIRFRSFRHDRVFTTLRVRGKETRVFTTLRVRGKETRVLNTRFPDVEGV